LKKTFPKSLPASLYKGRRGSSREFDESLNPPPLKKGDKGGFELIKS
jgi:hypothetical protein